MWYIRLMFPRVLVHDDTHAVHRAQLMQCYDFVQHVAQSTHRDGHTLDLVITRHDTTICDLRVGGLISDHAPVYFRLCVTKAVPPMQQVTRRAWRRLSTDAFASDLAASELCGDLTALMTRPSTSWCSCTTR